MHPKILEVIPTNDWKALIFTLDYVIIADLGPVPREFSFNLDSLYDRINRLEGQTPNEIYASHKSYALDYSEIIKLVLTKGFFGAKLEIYYRDEKHKFKLSTVDYYKCISALQPVLGDKLSTS